MATIDLNDVAAFVAVADAASFSVAARRLEAPKSSVSRRVARLESALGVKLLYRTTRRVALSTAGAVLYEKAARLIGSLRESIGAVQDLEEQPSGRLRVTTAVDFGATVASEIIARFLARYPNVEVELRLTNENLDLVAEGIDVALRLSSRPLRDSSLVARKVATHHMQLYASPSYLARRGTPRTPAELEGHDWVRFRSATSLELSGPGERTVVRLRGRVQCDDLSFVRSAVVLGTGIGALPTFLAEPDVAEGRLVRVLPRWTLAASHVWLVYPGGGPLPRKVVAFSELVVETLRGRKY